MKIEELEDIWYNGNRQDPNFINMVYNMLGYMMICTTEEYKIYDNLYECVQDAMEDWLREQINP